MDGLPRTRATKREIEKKISVPAPHDKTEAVQDSKKDTENDMIQYLREEKQLKWSEIVNILNQKRRDAGEAATLTEDTVYSRFVMHTTRTAEPVGEVGFDAKDYVHLRHPNQYTEGGGPVQASKAGKKRIKNYENARELKANMRQAVGAEAQTELETVEKTEQLVAAVAKMQRNFWSLVADEMERATTKLYRPEELASRYRDI